ncbi:MAG: autoinducer 2 ABC transporter substrate-binding protein [Armatimonadota bacterium]
MKRMVLIVACIALFFCAGGCSRQETTHKQEQTRTIVFVFKEIGIPYANVCARGARKAAKDLGISVEFLGPAKGADIAGQIAIIETQIARGVDAIVISPNDPNAVKPVVEKAMRKGIKVFTWDSDAPNTKRIFYVAAADDIGIGEDIMHRLARDIGNKGKVGIMSGGQGALNLNQHAEGVLRAMRKYPKIQLAKPIVYNNEQPQLAQSVVAGLLQKHPDLAGIACVNSPGPPAAARAVIAAGKAGKVKIWGLSLPSENRKYIKQGVVNGLILWDPAKLTYVAAKLVNDYLDGKKPIDGMRIEGVGKLKVRKNGVIIMPGVVITKDNVDTFDF